MITQRDWKQRLAGYFRDPTAAWNNNPQERQVLKLNSILALARAQHGLDLEGLLETVIEAVAIREPVEQSPIYLVNLGGCGSHWISRMMAEAGGLTDAGEVYLPQSWYSLLLDLPTDTSARIVDGIELAHGLLYNGVPGQFATARLINSAHGSEKIEFHRRLRVKARIAHLVRDPRDRTMSVSFRKDEFRRYENTGLDDYEYFLSKARRSLTDWKRYTRLPRKADVEIRYEDMRTDSPRCLQRLLAAMDVHVPPALAAAVSLRNSPEYLRSNKVNQQRKGNLDQGGIARSWRELPAQYRRAVHAMTAPAIVGQGYPLCDCFPEVTTDRSTSASGLVDDPIDLRHTDALIHVRGDASHDWTRLQGLARIPSDTTRIRIRLGRSATCGPWLDLIRHYVTDLCAAGVNALDDGKLQMLGKLSGLRALDLARTEVREADIPDLHPGLRVLNLSGCAYTREVPEIITVFRDFE